MVQDNSVLCAVFRADGRGPGGLAGIVGVTRRTISRWERGVQGPSSATLARLANLLGVPAPILSATPAAIREAVLRREEGPPTKDLLLSRALAGDKAALRIVAAGQGFVPEDWRRTDEGRTLTVHAVKPRLQPKQREQRRCPRCEMPLGRGRVKKHVENCREPLVLPPGRRRVLRGSRYARVKIEKHLGSCPPGGPLWVQGGLPQ